MSLPPKSYLDLFQSLSRDLKELKGEIVKLRLEVKEQHLKDFEARYQERLVWERQAKEYEAQIHQLNLDNNLLMMQSESTMSVLKLEKRHLESKYEHELVALMAILKLRIYDFSRHHNLTSEEVDESMYEDPRLDELERLEAMISQLRAVSLASRVLISPSKPKNEKREVGLYLNKDELRFRSEELRSTLTGTKDSAVRSQGSASPKGDVPYHRESGLGSPREYSSRDLPAGREYVSKEAVGDLPKREGGAT